MDEGNQMVERVSAALEASFKAAVADGAGRPFAETGVTSPKPELWARYARAAIEAMIEALESQPRYSTPVYDDIGMQDDEGGDWIRLSELPALTPPPSGQEM